MGDAWDPQQYARFAAEREQPGHDLVALLAPAPGGRLVDLGCGTGKLTRRAHEAARAAASVGVDRSPAMLALAAPHAGNGLRFARGDVATWAPDGPVDVVFSNAALHWVPDHPALLARLVSWLAPGGQLAVQMPDNDAHPSHRVAAEVAREEFAAALAPEEGRARILPLEEYALLLHRLGLGELHVAARVYLHPLPSREEVVEWVKGALLNEYKARLPDEETYARFLARYRERLFAALPDERPFPYTYRRIFLRGRKA